MSDAIYKENEQEKVVIDNKKAEKSTINGIRVVKRNGKREGLDLEKIHKVVTWAAEGLDNVSVSQVVLNANVQLCDEIKTEDIHEVIIKSAADLISEETPDYQYLAARLAIFHLRKKAYAQFDPPNLYDHVQKMVKDGRYDSSLLEEYTSEDFDKMNAFIRHSRDLTFSYSAVKQLQGKYLVQDRVTGQIFESAQFLYVLVAACLFAHYPKNKRLLYVERFYPSIVDPCSQLFFDKFTTVITADMLRSSMGFDKTLKDTAHLLSVYLTVNMNT